MAALEEKFKNAQPQVFLFLGIILAGLYYLSSGFEKIDRIDAEIKKLQEQLKTQDEELSNVKKIVSDKPKFEQELSQVGRYLEVALRLLPTEMNNEYILRQIYDEAKNSGVNLTSVLPKQSEKKDFYEELNVEIALEGSYSQITLFLSYVAKIPRIIRIKDVVLRLSKTIDSVSVLKLNGTLIAYRYLDKKTTTPDAAKGVTR